MPRRHKNARQRDRAKRLKCSGICVRIPERPYRIRGDTRPGLIVAEACPRTIEKDLHLAGREKIIDHGNYITPTYIQNKNDQSERSVNI